MFFFKYFLDFQVLTFWKFSTFPPKNDDFPKKSKKSIEKKLGKFSKSRNFQKVKTWKSKKYFQKKTFFEKTFFFWNFIEFVVGLAYRDPPQPPGTTLVR